MNISISINLSREREREMFDFGWQIFGSPYMAPLNLVGFCSSSSLKVKPLAGDLSFCPVLFGQHHPVFIGYPFLK